jgi:hypothetical protein
MNCCVYNFLLSYSKIKSVKLLHWNTKLYTIWTNVSKVEMVMRAYTYTHTSKHAHVRTYTQLFPVPLTKLNTLTQRA